MRLGIMSSGRGSAPILSCTRNNILCGGSTCSPTAVTSGRVSSTFLGCTRDSGFCGGSSCLSTAVTSGRVSSTFLSCTRDSGFCGRSSCSSTAATSGRSLRIITILRNSGIGSGRLRLITRNGSINLAGGLVVMAASSSTTLRPYG